MSTSYAEYVYWTIMYSHEWTYDEITELIELLDNEQEELCKHNEKYNNNSWEYPDEWDYSIIEKENCEAI